MSLTIREMTAKEIRKANEKLESAALELNQTKIEYEKESAKLKKFNVIVDKIDYSRKKLSVERRNLKEDIKFYKDDKKKLSKQTLVASKNLKKVGKKIIDKESLLSIYDDEIAKKKQESKDLTLDIAYLREDIEKRRLGIDSELSEVKTRLGDVFAMVQQKETTISILDTNIKNHLERNEELHARNDVLQKSLEQIDCTLKAKVELSENEIAKQNDVSRSRLKKDKDKLSKIYRDIEKRQKHIFDLKGEEELLTIKLEKLKENINA